jgi:peptidyl-Asp metalloendopeptidase
MTPGDNKMDEVFALRDQHLADVVVLLTNDQDSGALGVAPGVEVASGNAFAVVRWDFAAGNYTFAHEIGHLVGGDHATGSAPRQYAHGYRLPDYDWRTVMATISEDPGTIRIPYWSTPDLYVADPPRLANALGTASRNDNRKMWNLRANAVAGFRGATDPGSVTVTITGRRHRLLHVRLVRA